MTALFHFTCSHARRVISYRGVLRPHPQPYLDNIPIVWLTDLEWPDVGALGLTSHTLRCDRTENRYTVVDPLLIAAYRFDEWADARLIDRRARSMLTLGCQPRHWWVCEHEVPVRLDNW